MIKIFFTILLVQTSFLYSQSLTQKQKTTYAWQIALDANNFSPGLIDGVWGFRTNSALQEYLNSINYEFSIDKAKKDTSIIEKLNINEADVITQYTITEKDFSEIGPIPKGWLERSELKKMTYETLPELIQGKFHCSLKALKRLNPLIEFFDYKIGTIVNVPNVRSFKNINIKRLEIDLINRKISGYGIEDKKILLLNCSVAKSKGNLPKSDTFVKNKALNPNYTFNPIYWPEVKTVDKVLIIQPGPKNPVGLAWISLNLPGYGIHGTPIPDNIGKTGSHGCIRLTNWHAIHLLKSVNPGVPVVMIGKNPLKETYPNQTEMDDQGIKREKTKEEFKIQVFEGDQRTIKK